MAVRLLRLESLHRRMPDAEAAVLLLLILDHIAEGACHGTSRVVRVVRSVATTEWLLSAASLRP